jgi:hypothetical protein
MTSSRLPWLLFVLVAVALLAAYGQASTPPSWWGGMNSGSVVQKNSVSSEISTGVDSRCMRLCKKGLPGPAMKTAAVLEYSNFFKVMLLSDKYQPHCRKVYLRRAWDAPSL